MIVVNKYVDNADMQKSLGKIVLITMMKINIGVVKNALNVASKAAQCVYKEVEMKKARELTEKEKDIFRQKQAKHLLSFYSNCVYSITLALKKYCKLDKKKALEVLDFVYNLIHRVDGYYDGDGVGKIVLEFKKEVKNG